MATVTIIDLLDGNSGNLNISKGWSFDRQATVTGVDGDPHEKVYNATKAAGMPEIGDSHPIPALFGVILQDISCISVANDVVKLALKYRPPDGTRPSPDSVIIRVGSSLSQVDTNVDINGTVLFTTYTYPTTYKERIEKRGDVDVQPKIIQKLVPMPELTVTRLEDESPLFLSTIYVGKVNSTYFEGGLPRTWMCTNIDGNSQDGGDNYTVTYSFQYRNDTWDKTIVFEDPNTSHPPVFATAAAASLGIKTYQIYETLDFNQLGL